MASNVKWIGTLAVSTLAVSLPAQGESRGIFVGTPAAVSTSSGAPDDGQLYVKREGFAALPPAEWPAAAPMSFDLGQILDSCAGPTPRLNVNALSMGCDYVTVNSLGEVDVPENQWAAFNLSVDRGATGMPGSLVRAESLTASGVGADIFSYVLPGSAIEPSFVDRLDRAHDSREVGFGGAGSDDIDAMDQFIPTYLLEPGMVAMMPSQPCIYFSVAASDVNDVPAFWWGTSPVSAGNIFRVCRDTANGWGCPEVFLTFRELGIDQTEDVDALALDLTRNRVVFSTTTQSRNEILFVDLSADAADPVPVTEEGTGEPITNKIGLALTDSVDAICAMDPEVRDAGIPPPSALFFQMGIPAQQLLAPKPQINGSSFRSYNGASAIYESYMVGYPPLTGPGPGFALLLFTVDPFVAPIFQISPVFARSAAPKLAGDPQSFRFPINPLISMQGIDVVFRWFAVDAGLTEVAEAWPMRVTL